MQHISSTSQTLMWLMVLMISSSSSAALSLISDLRAEKIEQKSITLVWREPSSPNSNHTEYEIKYFEKVKLSVVMLKKLNISSFYGTQSSDGN